MSRRHANVTIMSLRPADTPEFMADAWLSCIRFALKQPDIIESFRAETGNHWHPGTTPIDQMIDEATEAEVHFLVEFIKWANVSVWGPVNEPPPR